MTSPEFYINHRLTIKIWCTFSMTIPNEVTVQMRILLCSWLPNLPTLTYNTQLASMWSISCNIQHLTHQQGLHKIQLLMLWKRMFHQFQWALSANYPSNSHQDIIKRMKATVSWRQKGSERSEHCSFYHPKLSCWWGNCKKSPFSSTQRMKNRSRMMWIERQLGPERKFKMLRQQLLKTQDNMRNAEKTRSITRKPGKTFEEILAAIGNRLSDVASSDKEENCGNEEANEEDIELGKQSKVTNLARWWAQSSKWYSTTSRVVSRSRGGVMNWGNRGWCCSCQHPSERYEVRDNQTDCSGRNDTADKFNFRHTTTNNNWRACSDSSYGPSTIADAASNFSTWN